MSWLRTCQECGYIGSYRKPNLDDKRESWRDTKCRKCKSEGLDFGREDNRSDDEESEDAQTS